MPDDDYIHSYLPALIYGTSSSITVGIYIHAPFMHLSLLMHVWGFDDGVGLDVSHQASKPPMKQASNKASM